MRRPRGRFRLLWYSLVGAGLPVSGIVIIHSPIRITLQFIAAWFLFIGLLIRGHTFTLPRVVRDALLIAFAGVALAAAVATTSPLNAAEFGVRGGAFRPVLRVIAYLTFALLLASVVALRHRRSSLLALVGGMLVSVQLASIYAMIRWVGRLTDLYLLPALNNDPYTEGASRAAFFVDGIWVPREAGAQGEPKFFVSWLLLALAALLWRRTAGSRSGYVSKVSAFVLLGGFTVAFSTGGVFSLLAFVAGYLAIQARFHGRSVTASVRARRRLGLVAGVGVLTAVYAWQAGLGRRSIVAEVLEQRLAGGNRYTYLGRSYEMAFTMWLERPILGHGLGEYSLSVARRTGESLLGGFYPGFYLNSLVEGGLVGGGAILLGLGILVAATIRRASRCVEVAPLAAFSVAWLLRALEIGQFDLELALCMGIAIAVASQRPQRPSSRPPATGASRR